MSQTIEQKVVEMRFDNSNFEKNVSKSMNSLEQLKNTIDKTSSGNAFTGLSKALDNINLSGITTAVQTVTDKFNFWEEVAIGAARNIGTAISNYVGKALNNLVFSNVFSGWDKYAQKTEAVQTIMASIADQDFGDVDKMEYVENIMERLTWFTDETSFHLTDMISNIGKFTSAGVGLNEASDAMMGIATWAAVSGANADTASRVMYQLSQSLGLGAVRTQDWMSVETANMATKEFKELAIQVAKTKGTIDAKGMIQDGKKSVKVSYQNFRETLKNNWLTSEVLTETLGQYSGFANALNRVYTAFEDAGDYRTTSSIIEMFEEVQAESESTGKSLEALFKEKYEIDVDFSEYDQTGKKIGSLTDNITALGVRAFKAAQEAKTFKEAIESVGEASASVWMNIWETIFGNYEDAKILWTDLANSLYDLFVEPLYLISDAFGEWANLGGRDILFGKEGKEATGAFTILLESVTRVQGAFLDAFGKVFPLSGDQLIAFSKKLQKLASRFKVTENDVVGLTKKFEKFLTKIQNGIKWFTDITDQTRVLGNALDTVKRAIEVVKTSFESTFEYAIPIFDAIHSVLNNVKNGIIAFLNAIHVGENTYPILEQIFEDLGEVANDLAKSLSPLIKATEKIEDTARKLGLFLSDKLLNSILNIIVKITQATKNLHIFTGIINFVRNALKNLKDGFKSAFDSDVFNDLAANLEFIIHAIKQFIEGLDAGNAIFKVFDKIKSVGKGVGSIINLLGRAFNFLMQPLVAMVRQGVFHEIGQFFAKTVSRVILALPDALGKIATKVDTFLKTNPGLQSAFQNICTVLSEIVKFVLEAGSAFVDFIVKLNPLSKIGNFISNIFGAFRKSSIITTFAEKIGKSFENAFKFFRDTFSFDYVKEKIKELTFDFSKLIDQSKLLSGVRNVFKKIGDAIKKLFAKDADLSGLTDAFDSVATGIWNFAKKVWNGLRDAANAVSDFVKNSESIQNAKKTFGEFFDWLSGKLEKWFSPKEDGSKGFFGKIGDFFKGLFGPSSDTDREMDEAVTEAESFGQKVSKVFTAIWNAIKWVGDKIGKLFNAIGKIWEQLGIGEFFSGLFKSIGDIFKGANKDTKPVEKQANVVVASMLGIEDGVSNAFVKGLGALGIAIPAIAVVKLVEGIKALFAPFSALREVVEGFREKVRGEVIAENIKAIGTAIGEVAKGLGIFLLEIAGAAVILAYADKITGGNLTGIFVALGIFVAELLTSMIFVLREISVYKNISGNFENGVASLGAKSNDFHETVESLGQVFLEIGGAIIMISGAVAVLAMIGKKYGSDNLKTAVSIIGIFLAALGGLAFIIGKFTDDETNSFLTLDKTGLALEHKGYAEGLYAVGGFMTKVGVAMLAMAAAAALVIKATGGDVNQMHEAFNGMMGLLAITMGALTLIVGLSAKMPTTSMDKAADAIKAAGISLVGIGVALRVIAKTVIMLGKEKEADLNKGVEIIGKIGLGILAFALIGMNAKGSSNFGGVGAMALEMAATAVIFAFAIKKIGEIEETKINKAINALGAFTTMVAVIGALAIVASGTTDSSTKFASIGLMLVEVSAAIVVVSGAMKALGEINPETFSQSIWGLLAAFGSLSLLFLAVSSMAVIADRMGSGVGSILAATAGMLLIAASVSMIAKTMADVGATFANNDGALKSAVITLVAITVALTILGVVAKVVGPSMLVFGAGLAAIGVGVALLGVGFSLFVNTLLVLAAEASLIGGALADVFGGFLDKVIALEPKIVNALMALLRAILKTISGYITEIASTTISLFKELLKILSDNINEILTLLGPLLDKIIVFITEKLQVLITYIQPIIEGIVTHILYIIGDILVPGLLSILNDTLIPGLLLALQTILNAILSMGQQIIDFIVSALTQIVTAVITNLTTIRDYILETIKLIADTILETIDNIFNGEHGILPIIDEALNGEHGILNIIDKFIGTLLENVRNRATDIVDTVLYLIGEAIRGIVEGTDDVLTGVEDLITTIAEHIVSMNLVIFQAIIDVIEGLAVIIETHSGDFWAAVKHLVKAIWNSFWSIFDGDGENSIGSLAKNIMAGLGQGIKDFVGEVTSGIVSIGSTIVSKFKEVFGIKSPSKVMAELGGYLDLGLAKGVSENVGIPVESIGDLGDNMLSYLSNTLLGGDTDLIAEEYGDSITNSLSDVLGGITDSLESDDFTPTITPVLDLSEIQNGANQIPGMLNSGASYSMGSSAAYAASSAYSPYEYYDGTEKVSAQEAQLSYWEALGAKMDAIAEKFGKAKVVLDTGAVVGGLLDPLDMAFGQKMAQVGRGVYSATK